MQESGDFASCAKWGARADDLLQDSSQLEDCLPASKRQLRTLVIMTVGGNDLFNLTKDAGEGATVNELWAETESFVAFKRQAIEWLYAPGRFPNGVFVVFGNMYEFTDATGDTSSCPAANLGAAGEQPPEITDMVIWANEQYLRIAVDSGADMVFMLESFCGHGFRHDDPTSPCYRGPGTARWFDDTCIHPNPTGHQTLADMFLAVIDG